MGIKRHIFVDILGLPQLILITKANILDRIGAIEAITKDRSSISKVETLMCAGGYTGQSFADEVKRLTGATVEIARRSELHIFKVIPKRWVVERSFA